MSSSNLRIHLTTFNLAVRGGDLSDADLRAWLAPAFGHKAAADGPPDMVVVSVQELTALHWTRETLPYLLTVALISFWQWLAGTARCCRNSRAECKMLSPRCLAIAFGRSCTLSIMLESPCGYSSTQDP